MNKRLPVTTLPLYINNISIPTTVSTGRPRYRDQSGALNASAFTCWHTSTLETSISRAAVRLRRRQVHDPRARSRSAIRITATGRRITSGLCIQSHHRSFWPVTDSYTGDRRSRCPDRCPARPSLSGPRVSGCTAVYKVGPNWFENMAAITSFPPLVPFQHVCGHHLSNIPAIMSLPYSEQ